MAMTAPSGPKEAHARLREGVIKKPTKPVRTNVPKHTDPPRLIPIAAMYLDSAYQRDLNTERVTRMVRDWDPRLAGTLVLSSRGDRLWVIDGQHRLAALRELGELTASAIVLTDLSQRDEADLFVRYNRSRAALNEWDLFRAETMAGHEDVWAIIRTFNRHHLTLTKRAVSVTNVQALGAVRRTYNLGGEELLDKVLVTIKNLWSHERMAWGATLFYGLGLFYYAFESHEQYQPERTQRVLESNTPLTFLRKAQEVAFTVTSSRSGGSLVAEAIRLMYNEGLSRPKQLGSIRGKKMAVGG